MFNALLGSFVAWSLTAGALPGPWPVAAALALGGALAVRLHATKLPSRALNIFSSPVKLSETPRTPRARRFTRRAETLHSTASAEYFLRAAK